MALVRIQATIQDVSLLPRDRYVNSFYAWSLGTALPTPTQCGLLADAVASFYSSGSPSVASFMPATSMGDGSIKIYDAVHAPPNLPLLDTAFASGIASYSNTSPLPRELSCCLSLHAPRIAGDGWRVGQSRGRLYIGPLNQRALATPSGNLIDSRPGTELRTALTVAAQTLRDNIEAVTDWHWVIYSPSRRAAGSDVYTKLIQSVSVDDAWDIQRSRGDRPTGSIVRQLVA